MHPRKLSVTLLLAVIVLCVGLLAGCGGGQSGGGSQEQGGGGGGGGGQGGQEQPAQESKIVIGNVRAVNVEAKRFTLLPASEEQGKEPQQFKLTPQAGITLGDKQAELADMEEGQQAQVEYIVRKDLNRARSVQLFEAGQGGDSGSGG